MSEDQQAQATRDRRVVTFRIMVDQPYGDLQRTLQRQVDFVAVGLGAIGHLPEGGARLPLFPMVRLGTPLPAEELLSQYQRWLVDRAIEGCIESLEPLLMRVWGLCRLSERDRDRQYTPDELAEVIREIEGAELKREPLGRQLDLFQRNYPGVFGDELHELLRALKKVRVCLTHAAGIVRPDDTTTDGILVVPVTEVWFELHDDEGGVERVGPGYVAERGGQLVLRRARQIREFGAGERLEITLSDFVGIAYTVFLAAMGLRQRAADFLKTRGVLPPDFQLPDLRQTIGVQYEAPLTENGAEDPD